MTNLFQTVLDLKTKAKNRRDMRLYGKAESFLEEAISLLENKLNSSEINGWQPKIASELSDCYGLLGGIYRRQGLEAENTEERQKYLLESIQAYDKGFKYEHVEEEGVVNSYNMLNRLVSRILYNPKVYEDPSLLPAHIEQIEIKKELKNVVENLHEQLQIKRRSDIWAYADLALANLLLDEEDPASVYAFFNPRSTPDYAYVSALSTLKPLAKCELPMTPKIQKAIGILEKDLQVIRHF